MSNEKENKKPKSAYVELEEKWRNQCQTISQQQDLINGLQKSGTEMGNEILHLKRVIAGQKGRLQQMSAENEKLNRVIKEKDMAIQGLESQVKDMSETLRKQANRIEEVKGDLSVAEANLEYYKSLPWWRKILV